MFKFLAISFVLVAGAFVFAAPVVPLALVYQGQGMALVADVSF